MNELDIELSKKSKIIEIGSVEKSFGSSKLAEFRKFRKSRDFRTVISNFLPKTVSESQKKIGYREKVF